VIDYVAGEVATKMLSRKDTNIRVISPARSAETSLRDLGFMPWTFGAWNHEVLNSLANSVPLSAYQGLFLMVGR
jgi:hypothetical protein